jgi:gas vesicle protein
MKELNDMAAEKKGKDLLVGAVVGTLLGAVTALLFAPKSGRELRADISEGVHQVSEKTQQVAESVTDKSKEIAGTITEKTQQAVKETAQAWKSGKAESAAIIEAPVAATIVESEETEK